jgi:sirohydrochlorin cobaltochelatase
MVLSSVTPRPGILVIGHGTRDPQGAAEFLMVARDLARQLPETIVEPCFLELAEPSIDQGLARLMTQRARRMTVAPLLLFGAGHAKQDIPRAVAEAARGCPPFETRQASPLECQPSLVELSTLRYWEAVNALAIVPPEDTLLILVGRGSRDAEATAAMTRFAGLRSQAMPGVSVQTCFLAMAEPSLEETLRQAATFPCRRIVVQPHLLFRGELLAEVCDAVQRFRLAAPSREWVLTEHLGPHPLLVEALRSAIELAGCDPWEISTGPGKNPVAGVPVAIENGPPLPAGQSTADLAFVGQNG